MATPSPSKRSTLSIEHSSTPSVLSCADGMSPRGGMEGSASNYRDGEIAGFENVAKYGLELDQPGEIGAWRGAATVVSARSAGVRRGSGSPCDQQACAECERKDGGEHQAHRETRYCRCFLSTATVQVSQGRTHR